MTPIGLNPTVGSGVAASAAGTSATGVSERLAKVEAAGHALAVGRQSLARSPLDGDPNTSADRDADGWTGSGADADPDNAEPRSNSNPPLPGAKPARLPDDPCGSRLDVTV